MPHRKDNSRYTQGPNPTKVTQAPSEMRTRPERRINLPNLPHSPEIYGGPTVCPRCHVIWDNKHWHLNEAEYDRLRHDASVEQLPCPACRQIEHEEYDGQVILRSPVILANQEAILGLIYHTERSIRESSNPLVRIASLHLKGDTIEVLTIGTFLAERIGKELKKAYHGELELKHLDRAKFMRVSWIRE